MIYNWEKENNQDVAAKIILFLISPFFSLLYSFRTLNRKSSFWVIFGFCVFFGLAFTVGLDRFEGSGDGITYRALFELYKSVSVSEYMQTLSEYFEFDEGAKDFYADTVSFLVSRITGNYHILFMVYAIVFSFFQLKSLRFFVSNDKCKRLSLYVFFLFLLFMMNQIFNINGVRFWTAAWIAVYSSLQMFYNGNKRYLFLAALTPFVHGSFFLFLIVVVIALFAGNWKKALLVVFVLSFAFSTLAVDLFNMTLDYLPAFMTNLASAYLDESNIIESQNQVGTGFWWLGKVFGSLSRAYINLLVILLAINKTNDYDKNAIKLLGLILILGSMANFTMPIPSVGRRFFSMLYPFIAIMFIRYMPENKYNKLIYLFPILFIFSFHQLLLSYFEVVGVGFFFSSPFIILYKSLFM